MSGYEVTWGGVSSSTIPEFNVEEVTRDVLGAHRGQLEEVPGQIGALYYPEERGMRDLTIRAYLLTSGPDFGPDRGDAFERMAEWLDVPGRNELIIGDWPDRIYMGVLTDIPKPREWRNLGRFDLNFWVDPYSLSASSSQQIETSTGGSDSGSFAIPDGVEALPVIEIKPAGGNITSFAMQVNGIQFSYGPPGPAIGSGSTLTVSSITPSIYTGVSVDTELTGAYNAGTLVFGGWGGLFPRLIPGTNNWIFSHVGTATSVELKFSWRRRHKR
jgi:predicted phage tail component-like protein